MLSAIKRPLVLFVLGMGFLFIVPPLQGGTKYELKFQNHGDIKVSKAGSIIPVHWTLKNGKARVIDQRVVLGVLMQQLTCTTGQVIQNVAPGGANYSGEAAVKYDVKSERFIFKWKTNETMKDKCYLLFIDLDDGDQHMAKFEFN